MLAQPRSPSVSRQKRESGHASAQGIVSRVTENGGDNAEETAKVVLVKFVRAEYTDIVRIWNSIGLAPDKKRDEAQLLQTEIEEIFHVSNTYFPNF